MRTKIFALLIPAFLASATAAYSIEYETSTGQEDIVLMSTDGEVNMGDSISKSVEKQFKVVEDDEIQKKVADIGQKIAFVCDRRDIIYHFKVIDARIKDADKPIINAFSLPGGYVYIFKDLYAKVANDNELAGVIGHEVGHIVARHSVKRMQAMYGANIAMIIAATAQKNGRDLGNVYAAIGALMMAYSRDDETFADKMAIKYTKKAGYNPEGTLTFLQKLLEWQQKEPEHAYIDDRSHPYLSIRISNAKKEIYGKMDFNAYINIPTETQR